MKKNANLTLSIMAIACTLLLAIFFLVDTAKAESEYVKITKLEQTSNTQVTITFEVTEPSSNLKIGFADTKNRSVAVTATPSVVGKKSRSESGGCGVTQYVNYNTNSYTQVLDIQVPDNKEKFDITFYVESQGPSNSNQCGSSGPNYETDKKTMTFDPWLLMPIGGDTMAPVPGTLQLTDMSPQDIIARWTAATDMVTAKENLLYSVYYSASDNIKTVADMEANGTLVASGLKAATNGVQPVSGLSPETNYYVNVIVADEAGNKAAYTAASAATLAAPDLQAPVPGYNGQVSIIESYLTNINILWTTGTDNKTMQENLRYRVYYSSSNNITTVADMEANGTPVGDYQKNLTRQNISGLSPGTRYYVNVIIMDEAGNKAAYNGANGNTATMPTRATPGPTDTPAPTPTPTLEPVIPGS